MIDLHSHIIPGIDDGCITTEEAISMVKEASEAGIKKIVCTPHYIKDSLENIDSKIYPNFMPMKKLFEMFNIDVELSYGSEIMIFPEIVEELKNGNLVTLNNSKYVLIEFPMDVKVPNVCKVIRNIVEAGFVPIIAHPERYRYVINDINEVKNYIEAGALMQIDISSLIGDFGKDVKKTCIKLLKSNLIHLWGSDSHIFRLVYDKLDLCFKELKKHVDEDYFNTIVYNNPEKIYNNVEV